MQAIPVAEAASRSAPGAYGAIELVPVGSATCLFRPDTQATALLNESAAAIAEAIISGIDAATIIRAISGDGLVSPRSARRDVDAVRHRLESEGFLTARSPAKWRPAAEPPSLGGGWWREHLKLDPGRSCELACEDAGLAKLLGAALTPLAWDHGTPPSTGIVIAGTDGAMSVWRDGIRIAGSLGFADARRVALQSLAIALLPPNRLAALLHASALEIEGRAVLLTGASGAGKTTLMLSLVADGAGYLSDDLTPLGRDGRSVSAFPTAASIKSGSWELAARLVPDVTSLPVHHVGTRRVRYCDLRRGQGASAATSPAAALLIVPRFVPEAELRITRFAPEEALTHLLASGTEIVGASRSIRPLIRLVQTVPAFAIEHSDARAAAAAVRRMLAEA